ncbi:MAG: PorT family protein [Chitinophagaceae bacterium]|nr:PorT family protein [Chitinophagaceae bacterium]
MPKFFLLSIILLPGIYTTAQTRFNLFAGPQLTSASYQVGGAKQSTQLKPGFQLGAGAKIEFENRLFFSPAIYYSYKGYKVVLNKAANPPDPTAIDNNTQIHTLETAFLLQYDFSKNPSHFFFKFGPSLDFQLSGKEKFDRADGSSISRSMKYSFSGYGRYAASAVLQVGYETSNNLIFYIHYAHGLTNLNNADLGPSIQHRVIGVTVGKYFK